MGAYIHCASFWRSLLTLFWQLRKYHHVEPPPKGTFSEYRSAPYSHFFPRNGETKHITEWNEQDGTEFLQNRPKEKPFFLTISFFATHAEDGSKAQYRPMNSSMHLYRETPVPIPETFTDDHWNRLPKSVFNERNIGRTRFRERYDTPDKYQHHMKVRRTEYLEWWHLTFA